MRSQLTSLLLRLRFLLWGLTGKDESLEDLSKVMDLSVSEIETLRDNAFITLQKDDTLLRLLQSELILAPHSKNIPS